MPVFSDQTVGLKCCECDARAHTWAPIGGGKVVGGCLEHPEKVVAAMKAYGVRSAGYRERSYDHATTKRAKQGYGECNPKRTY